MNKPYRCNCGNTISGSRENGIITYKCDHCHAVIIPRTDRIKLKQLKSNNSSKS